MRTDNKTIAFYIGSLGRGGAERVIVNLAQFFVGEEYDVYLVTKEREKTEYDVPVGVTRIVADITEQEQGNFRAFNLARRICKLRRIWREISPNIIVSFIRKNNLMAIASSRGMKIPVIVSIRSNPARELQGKFFKQLSFFMFRFADGIVMQTTQAKEYLPHSLQHKAVIMPNSIQEKVINSEVSTVRKKEIVSVGRIDANKNQIMLIKAFETIRDDYPEWSLHLYGDGEMESDLRSKYECDSIVFHGSSSHVIDDIKDSSVFVLTSRQEGMPNALIEAMALGLACISTNCPCGGPAELISDGENGMLIKVDDETALVNRLRLLLADEELRKTLGNNAVNVREKMHPDKVNAEWKSYIESIMN